MTSSLCLTMTYERNENNNIYEEDGIQQLRDEGQLSDWEAGFMQGAAGQGKGAKCRKCGDLFTDNTPLERDIDGERHLFCSNKCAEKFLANQEKKKKSFFKNY